MGENPFPGWLAEVASDEIVVDPEDIKAECLPNMWCFSVSPEQAGATTVQDVKDFISQIVEARSSQLRALEHPAGSMVFYCWHDFQAGQLRFSLVSASHGHLPFGNKLQPVGGVERIIESWLTSPWLHGIPLTDVRCESGPPEEEEEDEENTWVVEIWSTPV